MPYKHDQSGTQAFISTSHVWVAEFKKQSCTSGDDRLSVLSDYSSIRLAQVTEFGITIIFNGVLYNRASLISTHKILVDAEVPDTKLILELFRKTGDRAFSLLRGNFAILIFDQGKKRLQAFRDPVGISPLFYSDIGSSLLFSNSIDRLLAHPDVSHDINRPALADTLCWRWPEYDETYYLSIKRILTGHYLEFTQGGLRLNQYWDPSPPGTPDDSFTEEDLGEFDRYLEQAVQRCLLYGETGIYLSGGLDSVSVGAMATDLARRQGLRDPMALSLAFSDPACNEEDVQRGVASGLGINQIIIPFDEAAGANGLIYGTLLLASQYPQPLQNPWVIAYNNLAVLGKQEGYNAVLTGAGGDDWLVVNLDYMADLIRNLDFGGMRQMVNAMLNSYHAPRRQVIRYLLWTIGLRPVLASTGRKVLYKIFPAQFDHYRRTRMLQRAQTPDWIAPDPELRKQLETRTHNMIEKSLRRSEPSGPYGFYKHDSRSVTFSHPSLSMELEEDFEVGQHLGIKLLHPYWDADLIEFLCRIPPRLLLSGGREKGIVRQSIAKRFPNLGFEKQRKVIAGNVIQNILKNNGKSVFKLFGGLQSLHDYGIIGKFNDQFIDQILASPDLVDNFRVWQLLTLEAWVRNHT